MTESSQRISEFQPPEFGSTLSELKAEDNFIRYDTEALAISNKIDWKNSCMGCQEEATKVMGLSAPIFLAK